MTTETEKAFVKSLVKAGLIGEYSLSIKISHSKKWTRESWTREVKRVAEGFIHKGKKINYWEIPIECEKLIFDETFLRVRFSWF